MNMPFSYHILVTAAVEILHTHHYLYLPKSCISTILEDSLCDASNLKCLKHVCYIRILSKFELDEEKKNIECDFILRIMNV